MKKKEYKIIFFLMITIVVTLSTIILEKPLNNLDEIWNYNLSRNIAENKVPYKDFNIVQMPLFFMITSVFLRICNEIITTRILAIILNTIIMLCTYKLFRKLKINQYGSAFATLLITYILLDYFCLDYNFFNVLLILILMLLEFKNIEVNNSDENKKIKSNVKIEFLIGIIAGCSFLVKQTTGAFVIIATMLIKLFYIRKNNFKLILKTMCIRIIGICIPILIFASYLTVNNAWHDFIDYTVLGIFTFDNKIPYLNLLTSNNLYIKVLSSISLLYFVGMIVACIWKKRKNILILTLYSLASFIVVYPIADNIHFLIGIIPTIIGIIYVIYNLIGIIKKKYLSDKIVVFLKYMLQCAFYITTILIIIIQSKELINTIHINNNQKEIDHFKYIPVNEKLLQRIKNVDEYIINSDRPVYILDASAALYMIPINRYNKDYDMFLKGNIGGSGEEGQIEKIKNMKNSYILIKQNKKNRNWQTPTKVIDFIEENFKKVDSIEIFDVYNLE